LDSCSGKRDARSGHLLIVDSWHAFGGGERYVLQVVEGMLARGFRVTVAAAHEGLLEAVRRAGAGGLAIHHAMRQRTLRDVLRQVLSWRVLRAEHRRLLAEAGDVDEVHIVTLEEQMLATPVYARAGRRVTWSVHGPVGIKHNPLQWLLYRRAARHVDRMIAVSTPVKQSLVDLGVDAEKIEVIPHGVEAPAQPSAGSGEPVPVVAFVGRLEATKDPLLFVEVAAAAHAVGTPARFVMYGAGSLEREVRAAAERHGLGEDVLRIAGHVDDTDAIYRSIDLLLLTSRYEGFGLVLVEAGAAGIPVVVADLPAMAEVVDDGVTGLIRARSAEALAAAIRELATDRERRARMGAAARSRVIEQFSAERMLDRTAAVLFSAAPKRSPG
jgi:glycosyltransferase involved in cell wall biosynthesis